MISSILKNYLIDRDLKKTLQKNDIKYQENKIAFDLVSNLNRYYRKLIKNDSKFCLGLDDSWKFERAFFLYYIIHCKLESKEIEPILDYEISEMTMSWLISIYKKTVSNKYDPYLREFELMRGVLYNDYLPVKYFQNINSPRLNFPENLKDIIFYFFYYKPKKEEFSIMEFSAIQLNVHDYIDKIERFEKNIEEVINPYFRFINRTFGYIPVTAHKGGVLAQLCLPFLPGVPPEGKIFSWFYWLLNLTPVGLQI